MTRDDRKKSKSWQDRRTGEEEEEKQSSSRQLVVAVVGNPGWSTQATTLSEKLVGEEGERRQVKG